MAASMATFDAPLCVYTIKHSDDLISGRSGTFHEKRAWATAKRLVDQADRKREPVIVLFAAAEKTDKLIARAILEDVQITETGTDYTFSNLKKFRSPVAAQDGFAEAEWRAAERRLPSSLRDLPETEVSTDMLTGPKSLTIWNDHEQLPKRVVEGCGLRRSRRGQRRRRGWRCDWAWRRRTRRSGHGNRCSRYGCGWNRSRDRRGGWPGRVCDIPAS